MLRYNSTDTAMEAYIGSSWQQFVVQTPGSTTNVTASGPPVSAGIFTPVSATCNYSPGVGTCSNIDDGVWPANGTLDTGSSCLELDNWSYTGETVIYDLGAVKTINHIYASIDGDNTWGFMGNVTFSTDGVTYSSSTQFGYPNSTPAYSSTYRTNAEFVSVTLSPNVTARYVQLTDNAGQYQPSICQFAVGP
jgi:hypothetical protein